MCYIIANTTTNTAICSMETRREAETFIVDMKAAFRATSVRAKLVWSGPEDDARLEGISAPTGEYTIEDAAV